jgi:phage I-like protein
VKALVDAGRLPLSGKPKAPGLDGGAGGGQPPGGQPVELAAEELAIAQKLGLTVEQYQKAKKVKER